jgi:DNA-binding MarR family transcriptional regulator
VKSVHNTPPEAATAALDRVLELVVLLDEDMTRGLAGYGLTTARAHLVWVLHRRGPSTQRALADALKVSARNITGLVDGLVATGYVTREPHPTDRRATLVSLTEHGASTLAEMDHGHRELAGLLFGGMPAQQFDGFVGGLDHVLDRLRAGLRAGGER